MATNYMSTAKKLQRAINDKFDLKILINTSQWYSEDQQRPVNMYTVKQVLNNEKGKRSYVELFKTYSTVQLTLFFRDLWYELNGWEIPKDNKIWEGIKKKYAESGKASEEEPVIQENGTTRTASWIRQQEW